MNTLPIDLLETPAAVIDLSRMLRNIARAYALSGAAAA